MSNSITTERPPEPESRPIETYRSLSLLALVGFLLALVSALAVLSGGLLAVATAQIGLFWSSLILVPALVMGVSALRGTRGPSLWLTGLAGVAAWAVIMGLGGLLVVSRHDVWMLPIWFWLVPGLAALLSWVARRQIQASENTLSGEDLARMGLIVSVATVAIYGAYASSSTMALQSQARACALDFLDQIKKGDDIQAFIRTIRDGERPQPGAERDTIETLFKNPSGPTETSPYGSVVQGALYRLIRMGGDQTTFEERGLQSEESQGNTMVYFTFRGRTPYYTFNFIVATEGQKPASGSSGRRKWSVVGPLTRLVEGKGPEPTERGAELPQRGTEASALLDLFLGALMSDRFDEAYLLTRPPTEREGDAAKAALALPARADFAAGKLIDVRDLWAPVAVRGPAIESARKAFDPKAPRKVEGTRESIYGFMRNPAATPLYEETEGKHRFTFPVRLMLRDPVWAMPKYVLELDAVLEGTATTSPRVVELLLRRAAPPPEKKDRPG